jgi:NADPH-dependent glutamate synthase beta subunit-like oxidoreductase/ferredoxin
VILAVGAQKGRVIVFPGSEHAATAYDFLKETNSGKIHDLKGRKVVVIGAGNVGMDVASEAYNFGAESVIAVDIQKPAAFGKEVEAATSKGTQILYPKITERYDHAGKKIYFTDGTALDADVLIISVGDVPVLDFLPSDVHTERGWIAVNNISQTSDVKVFAIGDVTGLGLVTHAIGQGRLVAETVHYQLMHAPRVPEIKQVIEYEKIKREYYEACTGDFTVEKEGQRCLSCSSCRDCHMCETTCYWGAISRKEIGGVFGYVVDEDKCIGCGFCAGICPCGVWEMVENV